MPYAAQTKESIAQSKTDIEALLARYGATGFGYVTEETGRWSPSTWRDAGCSSCWRCRRSTISP